MSGAFEYRVGRSRDDWETSVDSGPYVTIRTGGPLDGLVTLRSMGFDGRVAVEATWGPPNLRFSIHAVRGGHTAADALAQAWAHELAAGREPVTD